MKKIIFMICVAFIFMIGNSYALFDEISVPIKLRDNTSNDLTGEHNFSFNIYNVTTGGTSLYESNQTITADSFGVYNIVFKDMNLSFNERYYLGLNINSTGEMSPRINITDVGTAINTDAWDDIDTPMNITEMGNITLYRVNATCCVYLGTIQATDGNSINIQPTGDEDDFFSFKTPGDRPTIKREGGKFIYFDSTNVYDVGISLRYDDTYSGTLNYEKDEHAMTLLGKNSPVKIKTNSEYLNYFLFETYNYIPQLSAYNATELKIADNLTVDGNLTVDNNLTVDGYISGQPIIGSIGSGIINCSENLAHCGCMNVTSNEGLEVHYPEFTARVVDTDGTEIYCYKAEGDINVTNNLHSTNYLNSSCEWNSDSFETFHSADLSPGGKVRIFDALVIHNVIKETKGNTLLALAKDKTEQIRIFCSSSSHLSVCNGFEVTQDTFPSFNVSYGNSVYLNTYLPSDGKSSSDDGIHITHHENGSWVHTNATGLNITHCDNGTDLVECTGTVYRQYPSYSLNWNSYKTMHMLSPLTTGATFTSLSSCVEATPDYILPSMEEYVAIVHHIYCARRTDTVWNSDAWVDLRAEPIGVGGTPDLSPYLTIYADKPLLSNWDIGAYNFTNTDSWFLGKVNWSSIQNEYTNLSQFTDDLGNRDYTHLSNFTDDIGVSSDWDEIGDVPVATPSNGDTTHLSTADQIRDYIIGLNYITNSVNDLTNYYLKTEIDTQGEIETIWGVTLSTDSERTTGLAAQDACSEITGCVENAITDGNTNWDNSYGFFDDITNFTGILTDTKWCVYDSANTEIDCNVEPVTDTSANTVCSGGTTYLDGDGNCDDISSVYQPLEATLTDIADGTINENLINTVNPWADEEVSNTLTVTGYMQDEDINTFSELQSWVSGKTLLNEEDIFTIDANWVNTANPWADNEVSDTLTASNLVAGSEVVADTEVVNDLTIESTKNITSTAGIRLNDDVKIYLGTDDDSYIYDNGTALIIGRD